MATNYRLDGDFDGEIVEKFNNVLRSLRSERYPNGVGGNQDRMAHLFEDAGFVVSRYVPGNPHCAANYWFKPEFSGKSSHKLGEQQ